MLPAPEDGADASRMKPEGSRHRLGFSDRVATQRGLGATRDPELGV